MSVDACTVSSGDSLTLKCSIKWNKVDWDSIKDVIEAVKIEWNGSTTTVDTKEAVSKEESDTVAFAHTNKAKFHSDSKSEQYSYKIVVVPKQWLQSVGVFQSESKTFSISGMLNRLKAQMLFSCYYLMYCMSV